jgi:hypothetical protein
MALYMVEVPHEEAHCRPSMHDMLDFGPEFLAKWDWGCDSGVHTGWAQIEAGSPEEARSMLPNAFRANARVIEINKAKPPIKG